MGYGVGEYVAATLAGVFSLEDALKLVAARTQLKQDAIKIETFAEVARQVTYTQPQIPIISSLTGEVATAQIATPEYWCAHLQQPGKFATETGDSLFLVLASLLPLGDRLSDWGQQGDAWQAILHSLGELFVRGTVIDWFGFDRDYSRRRLQLPTYPFQRQRYWFKTPEHGHQEELAWQQMSQTHYVNPQLMDENQQIAQSLRDTGNFSEAQMKLVPQLLEALAQQRSQMSS